MLGFVAVCRISLVAASRGYSSCGVGLLTATASLLWYIGSSMQASVVVVHGLSCSMARGIFPDQGQTDIPCITGQILNHWTTMEVPNLTNEVENNRKPELARYVGQIIKDLACKLRSLGLPWWSSS